MKDNYTNLVKKGIPTSNNQIPLHLSNNVLPIHTIFTIINYCFLEN
jgi:hypothetical protein